MSNEYILARFSHGNEPIFMALNIAYHLMVLNPNLDIVLPVPGSKIGLLKEIADNREIDRRRVYPDTFAADIALAYGVYWGNAIDHKDWLANNVKYMPTVNEALKKHYTAFSVKNLENEEKAFKSNNARIVLSTGDLYDDFGMDVPIAYAFPLRHSEMLKRSKMTSFAEFGNFMRNKEKKRSVNFIPRIHSLEYDKSYEPLENEEFTPHMKESPVRADIAIPNDSIGMVFSGTGKKIEELKQIVARTGHKIVTGLFSPVDGEKYVKITPPRAEFVHVYADPRIRAIVGQLGYGMLWSAWNAGKPVVYPAWVKGDDEEFIHNAKTVKKHGLGVEIKKPEQVDEAVEIAQFCIPYINATNAELKKEFGTLDGPAYIAKRIVELGLY
ncbi:MAG: hypothetical protein V1836_01845 [Candidatus Aenigmatarchaeota archaeon]